MSGAASASGSGGSNTGAAYQAVLQGSALSALVGSPSVSFWRYRHNPHSNFALDNVTVNLTQAQFGAKGVRTTVPRAGDLMHRVYCILDIPALSPVDGSGTTHSFPQVMGTTLDAQTGPYIPSYEVAAGVSTPLGGGWVAWTQSVGYRIIEKATVRIGSADIDDITSLCMYVLDELHGKAGRRTDVLVGRMDTLAQRIAWSSKAHSLYVPLPFWFTQLSGSAISLATLSGNNVEIAIDFAAFNKCVQCSHTDVSPADAATSAVPADSSLKAALLIEYVYLSAEERQIFTSSAPANVQFSTGSQAGGPPSYDQLMWYNQYKTLSATGSDDVTIDLQSFVNPVFELLFAARLKANLDANDWTNFSRCGPSQSGATGFAGTHEHKPPLAGNTDGNFSIAVLDEEVGSHNAVTAVDLISAAGFFQLGSQVVIDADVISRVSLQTNGAARFAPRTLSKYFRSVQMVQHHSSLPRGDAGGDFIYAYSFSLSPETPWAPSGALNTSRLSSMALTFQINQTDASVALGSVQYDVIGRTMNVLQYRSGSAGRRFG